MSEEGKFSAPELELLLNNSGNEVCCDCKGKNPYWSSINNGVYFKDSNEKYPLFKKGKNFPLLKV
jgi:hypothetical protein